MLKNKNLSEYNPFEWPIFGIIGITGGIIYCTLIAISFLLFPTSFNWSNNYLSTLGDYYDNPNGAIFYIVGMIIAGAACIIFDIGLYKWVTKEIKSRILFLALIFGVINGLSIMLAGFFSETQETYALHVFWGLLIFISFFPFLILVNIFFLTRTNVKVIIIVFGFIVALIDAVFTVSVIFLTTVGTDPFMEWLSIFSYIAWACLLALNTIMTPRLTLR